MTTSPNKFSDPIEIPIKFSQKLPQPIFAFGESSFPVAFSFSQSPRPARFEGAVVKQLNIFLTDKNAYTSSSVVQASLGEMQTFTLRASGADVNTAQFNLSTTRTDGSTSISQEYKVTEIRQPSFVNEMVCSFDSHITTQTFDGTLKSGNMFYPSAIMKISPHTMLSTGDADLTPVYTSETEETRVIFAPENAYGLVDIEVDVVLVWYEDESRTILASNPPVIETPKFGIRIYVSEGSKFAEKLIVSGNSCVATALYPTTVLQNLGGDNVDLAYWGSGEDNNGLFWGRENDIVVSTTGLAIQDYLETASYILINQLNDYDESSSSSTSSSSKNSSSSSSSVLNTSSTSSTSSASLSSRSSASSSTRTSRSSSSLSYLSETSLTTMTSESSLSSTELYDFSTSSSIEYNISKSSSSSLVASKIAQYSFTNFIDSAINNPFGRVEDETGNNNTLFLATTSGSLGPPQWGFDYGISNGGFKFFADSISCDYLKATNPMWKNTAKSFSIWFKTNSVGNQVGIPFCISNGYVLSKTEFAIQTDSTNGQLSAWVVVNGSIKWKISTNAGSIPSGSWTHCVICHNGTQPFVYINGMAMALNYNVDNDKSAWLSDLISADNVFIGGTSRYYYPLMTIGFSGYIDEITIWDETLSESIAISEFEKNGSY